MNEIRFSDSLDKTKEFVNRIKSFEIATYNDRCDTCHEWRRGIYKIVDGEFKCINCLARDYFERLVGKEQSVD